MARLGWLFCLAIFFLPPGSFPREAGPPLDENIRRLGSKDAGERGAAAVALGELGAGAKKALRRLLVAAGDPDALVRERSVEALARIAPADKRTIQALVRRFSDPDPYVAGKAASGLARSGEAAVTSLVGALADKEDNVRWCAAIALGKIAPGGTRAIPPLTSALKDKNSDVRWCAAIALGRYDGAAAPAVPGLLARLRDDDRDVRWAAYVSLARIDREKIDRAPELSALIEKLEELTPQLMKELNVPGVAICVIRDNEPVWSTSVGVTEAVTIPEGTAVIQSPKGTAAIQPARSPTGTPASQPGHPAAVNGETMFEACSMSKPVFAFLALKLAEQGKLDLDKPLGEYLAEPFVSADEDYPQRITARMVLTHTSGLPNWRKGGEEREGPLPVYFKPGTKFSYSGEGIYYLQRVVERITGEPLAAYAKRALFDPLGFRSTSYVWSEGLDPRIATGHDAAGRRLERSRYAHANAAYTLYTTAREYAKFIAWIMKPGRPGGCSLSAEMTAEMLARRVRMDSRDVIDRPGRSLGVSAWRGLGWVVDETISGDIAYHSGSNQTGFTCYSQFDRREGSGIVIMTNGKGGSELWTRLIGAVGDL